MMKKIFFALVALIGLICNQAQSQTLVDNYRFDTGVEETAWIDITGVDSALVASPTGSRVVTSVGAASQLTDIGFTFHFAGTDYTTFGFNLMGSLRLGARNMSTPGGTNILSHTPSMPKIDGLGVHGMLDSSCYIHCATVGTAGNRVLVVEARMGIYQHEGIYVCWQTQLYENTGEIYIVYGPSEGTDQMPSTQPGLAKTNTDMLFLNLANNTVERYVSTPVPVNDAGVWPEEGRCYIFMPDNTACPPPPTVTMLSSNLDSTVLSWASQGSAWRLCIPDLGIDVVTTDTVLILNNINPTTVYRGTIQNICSEGDSSLRLLPFSFTTGCGTVHLLPWSDDFQLAASDDCWTKQYTTSTWRWRRTSSSNSYYMRVPSGTSSILYNEWLVSPPVELPNTVGLTLGWLYRSTRYSSRTPQVRVRLLVCDSTDNIDTSAAWVTLCEMDHYEQYFQQYYRLLDTWAGHRVRIAFQRVGAGGGNSDVDNVSIEIRMQPEMLLAAPALVQGGDTVMVMPVMTSGVLSNPVYDWHSTMEERGLANRLAADDTLQFVYLSSGTDTITLTLTTDYGTATATVVIDVMDCRPVTHFPWHEGFEHNLDCWTMPINGISVWDLLTTDAHSGQGSVGSISPDVRYPYDTLVSQPIVVPTDAHGLTLMWWMKHNGGNASVRQMYVNALNAANPVWSASNTLFYCQGNDISTSWQQYTVDLEPLAGQTIRLAWTGGSGNGLYYVYMDDIEIRYTRELVGSLAISSAKVYEGDTVTATINLTEGDTAGITYLWTSSMENNGLATILGNGPQVSIDYNGAGIDTIIVTVSNNYGTFTDTAFVHICPVMDDLPWVVDFSNDFPCWQVLDGTCEVTSNGYLSFTDWPTAVASSPLYVPTDGNVVLEFDCAYSFFYGSYLVMVTTDMTTFDTIGNYPFVSGRHPSAHIPLTAYAGQHIRLVFMATGQFLQFYLFNMSVRYSFEPVVSLAVDGSWFPGTELAIEATLVEGDTNGITYSWTSTKAQNGEATLIQDSSAQAQITCYTGGPDTVTVVATNSYGSDTAWCTVNIKPCDTVDALQWMEDFTNYFTCWWQPEGSQWTLPDNPYYTMAVAVNVWHPTDSWLVSRAITLPTLPTSNGDELMLCWDASTQLNDTHSYCVMVTTAADYRDLNSYDTLIAIDTVHPDITVGWSTMRVPLNAYAGQTIRLAFRYTTENHVPTGVPGLLIIDNVHIIDTTIPEVPDTIWRNVSVYMVNISGDTLTESDGVSVTGTGVYADSTLVTLTAIHGHYPYFWYWVNSVGDTIRDNPYSFIITSDTIFTAIFGPRCVGIGNVDGLPNVAIHPNPTTGDAYINVGVPSVVTVTDLQGRTVIQPTQVDSTLRIAQSTLPKGIYFVSVGNSAGTTVKKLVIQ